MQQISRSLLALSVTLASANTFAGEIQQVNCTDGCGQGDCTSEGCVSNGRSKSGSGRNGNSRLSLRDRKALRKADAMSCSNGRCGLRGTARDFALDWVGPCSPTGRLARCGCKLAQAKVWCCRTKAFPDSGWAPPAHVPVRRTGATYGTNWATSSAAGYGAGAPMVYQPTDTTQLGYSYANVPTWRPNPGMIPPVPTPSNFHNRFCPPNPRCGSCSTSCDACMDSGMMGQCMEYSCDACDAGYVNMMQQNHMMQMARVHGVRPVTTQPQPQTAMPVPTAATVHVANTRKPQAPVQLLSTTSVLPPESKTSAIQPPAEKAQPNRQSVRRPTTQRSGRKTAPVRRQKSGGWFGLPSLSEMSFYVER